MKKSLTIKTSKISFTFKSLGSMFKIRQTLDVIVILLILSTDQIKEKFVGNICFQQLFLGLDKTLTKTKNNTLT